MLLKEVDSFLYKDFMQKAVSANLYCLLIDGFYRYNPNKVLDFIVSLSYNSHGTVWAFFVPKGCLCKLRLLSKNRNQL